MERGEHAIPCSYSGAIGRDPAAPSDRAITLTAPDLSVAVATDRLPELFRLRLHKPRVFILLSVGFPVGRLIMGT